MMPKTSNSLRKWGMRLGAVAGVLLLSAGAWVGYQHHRFQARMSKQWDISFQKVSVSPSAELMARGEHLAQSLGGCATADCHGSDLGGGIPVDLGPIGVFVGGNITPSGSAADYSDEELLRLLTKGIKKDGTSVRFMPVQEFAWLPRKDHLALIVYLRSIPPAPVRPQPPTKVGIVGAVLDNQGHFVIDVASYISEHPPQGAPEPAPTASYGRFVASSCSGCHGETFSGGALTGSPPDLPIPSNLTPHDTGMAHYSKADFERFIATGVRPNGSEVDGFMPMSMLRGMDEIERDALWAFLRSLPPRPFGNR